MITKKRLVLVAKKKDVGFLNRFEGLSYIEDVAEIPKVWANNKTPVVAREVKQHVSVEKIDVPEKLIDKDKTGEFTEFCHTNGFECGELITGQYFDTKYDRCFLCEIAKYRGFKSLTLYNQFVDNVVDCIIYESPRFFVVPELGALKQGYLMIVPKEHILSVAQFPENYREEYDEVCSDVQEMLLKAFDGRMVCFMEHGSGPSGLSSHKKSIVHAHTHVVVDFMLKLKFKEMIRLKTCKNIDVASHTHYFSYQEGCNGQLMIAMDEDVFVQRQFPRQVMAEELGFAPEQYNWRCYKFEEVTEATLFHLWSCLKKEKKGRIYERTKEFVEGFSKRTQKKDNLFKR